MDIPKGNPRQLTYKDHKKFDSLKFKNELKNLLAVENIANCTKFNEKFLEVLNKHAPFKKRLLRAIDASYISKSLRNNTEVLARKSVLLNPFKKQKSFCKKLFISLNPSFLKDNKFFLKIVKLYFQIKEILIKTC